MEVTEIQHESTDESNAIIARDVWLSYGGNQLTSCALKGLNLTAPRGKIYGLLGPSGCGKTSLLRSIMGRIKLKSGVISIFGKPPGDTLRKTGFGNIGYMPQDLGLNDNLTLKETLHLFGAISGMKEKEIKEKSKFLINFLKIKFYDKQVCNMSGGQKKRTSFAVALLCPADIIILDEPTVGVDPSLRQKIWDYLTSLTCNDENPVTILVTTHYVEEAHMAHNVGFMLDGQLLAESTPKQIMEDHRCDRLEQVFLNICIQKNIDSNKDASTVVPLETRNKSSLKDDNDVTKYGCARHCKVGIQRPRWFRIKALVRKNMQFYSRHYGFLLFEILLPPLIMVCFALAIGPISGVPVGVVNHDIQDLGQSYLNNINKDVIAQVPYDSYTEATRAAVDGAISGVIYINPNFSESMRQRIIQGGLTTDIHLENSLISVAVDETNPFLSMYFHIEIANAFQRFTENLLHMMNLNSLAGEGLLKRRALLKENENLEFSQYIFPAVFISIVFFMAMALTTLSLITDRKNGTYERSSIIGVGAIDYILAHLITQVLTLTFQIALLMVVTFQILGFTCQGSYLLVILLAFLQGLCGMTLGFTISAIFEDDTSANIVSIGIWCILSFTQGNFWPLEGIADGMRHICLALPQTYAIYAIRSVVNRGWSLLSSEVIVGFSSTIGWSIFFLIFSWFWSTRKKM